GTREIQSGAGGPAGDAGGAVLAGAGGGSAPPQRVFLWQGTPRLRRNRRDLWAAEPGGRLPLGAPKGAAGAGGGWRVSIFCPFRLASLRPRGAAGLRLTACLEPSLSGIFPAGRAP